MGTPYRNRPDRRKAQLLPTASVIPALGYSISSIDGQHFTVNFTDVVTWTGGPDVFKFWNYDDNEEVVMISAVLDNPQQITFNAGSARPGTYAVAPKQPINQIVGLHGGVMIGTPIQFTV